MIVAIFSLLWYNSVRILLRRDCKTVTVVNRVAPMERWQRLGTSFISSRRWLVSRNLGSLLLLSAQYLLFPLLDHLLLLQKLDRLGERLFREPFCHVRIALLEENPHYVGWQNLRRSLLLVHSPTLSELLELAEVAVAHDLLHVDGFHLGAFGRRQCWVLMIRIRALTRTLDHDQKTMVLEQVDVSAR